jgi:hypothetical protein
MLIASGEVGFHPIPRGRRHPSASYIALAPPFGQAFNSTYSLRKTRAYGQ